MLLSQPQTEIISTTNDEKIQVATITTTTTTTASESVSASTSNVESVESKSVVSLKEIKNIQCKSEKLNLEYDVHIESSTYPAQQRCYIMTVHDIGFDHTQYERFVNCEQMTDIRNRVVWIHVNLPGQSNVGTDQRDLEIKKYPTFEELGEELVCVVDQLKIPQVVCMGEGAGASLSVYFALKYPNRCLGLVLIEPIATSPTIFESIKYKLNNLNLLPARFRQNDKLSNIFRRMEKRASFASNKSGENEALHNTSDVKLFDNNNFNLFADSYFNRPCILEKLKDLKVDALVAVGKNSCSYGEAKKFYKTLHENRRMTPEKMVNTPFIEIENTSNALHESTNRLAVSIQYFLQGIGLLSAMPMRNVNVQANRKQSMTSYTGSFNSSSETNGCKSEQLVCSASSAESSSSQHASSNPSLNGVEANQ